MNATALISQISACGARFEVNGETVRVIKPRGAVIPAGLLQAAREAKAEIRKALSQGAPQRPGAANLDECAAIMEYDGKLPRAWAEYLARLVQGPPPGDFQARHWQAVVDGALRFADERAGEAYALGWQPDELFGLDAVAPAARVDRRGLAFMLANGARVVSMDTTGADILMPGGARQRFYRAASNRLPPATLATAAAATDDIEPVLSVAKSQVSQAPIGETPAKQAETVAAVASVAGVAWDAAGEGRADDQANRTGQAHGFAAPRLDAILG
jgi:hypothetical protein